MRENSQTQAPLIIGIGIVESKTKKKMRSGVFITGYRVCFIKRDIAGRLTFDPYGPTRNLRNAVLNAKADSQKRRCPLMIPNSLLNDRASRLNF